MVAFLLVAGFRCPLLGQGALDQLRVVPLEARKPSCARIIDYFSRQITLRDNGQTYLGLGIRFDRATTLANSKKWVLERQARAGLPLVAGYRLGRVVLEAGGFMGVDMCRPQAAYLTTDPTAGSREFSRSSGLLVGMGMQVFEDFQMNVQYTHLDDLPENTALGRLNIGWQWTW
jgi:hypothetical protein